MIAVGGWGGGGGTKSLVICLLEATSLNSFVIQSIDYKNLTYVKKTAFQA